MVNIDVNGKTLKEVVYELGEDSCDILRIEFPEKYGTKLAEFTACFGIVPRLVVKKIIGSIDEYKGNKEDVLNEKVARVYSNTIDGDLSSEIITIELIK